MTTPNDAEITAFAERHGLSRRDARDLLQKHGHDDQTLAEATRNLVHFLRAPS